MSLIMKILNAVAAPFKWAYSVLPGFREGAAKWTQTLVFYTALGASVFTICTLPFVIPIFAKALSAFACVLLLSFISVVRTRVSVSEKDVQLIKEQKVELETALEKERLHVAKLKEDIRNQQSRFLDMSWIWEVNLAEVRLESVKLFDYFLRGKEDPIPWSEKPEHSLENDKRAIGALKVDYTAKIGIDLKQVLIHHDPTKRLVQYWIPEPHQTGALDPSDTWAIRTAMDFTTGDGFLDLSLFWRWHDEDAKNTALPIWEKEKTERYKEAFASKALTDQLGTAIRNEAEGRLKAFFETLLGCTAEAVSKDQLAQPDTLGVLLPVLMNERTPMLEVVGDAN